MFVPFSYNVGTFTGGGEVGPNLSTSSYVYPVTSIRNSGTHYV